MHSEKLMPLDPDWLKAEMDELRIQILIDEANYLHVKKNKRQFPEVKHLYEDNIKLKKALLQAMEILYLKISGDF